VCHLAADDPWLQTFIRPLVEAAGYRVVDADDETVDLAIMTESEPGQATDARQIIRLRSTPDDIEGGDESIYRYDHASLVAALKSSGWRRHA
jgi:two-component system chemotaxis sensor kinase CheA